MGALGEQTACNYLLLQKYTLLATNLRVKNNEIDIVALDQNNNELVFIEVKTRKNSIFGNPEGVVTNKKIQSINFVAKEYIKSNHCNLDYRFDIIAISYLGHSMQEPQIEHFENITWP